MHTSIDAILFDVGGTLRTSTRKDSQEKVAIVGRILALLGSSEDVQLFTRKLTARAGAYRKWSRKTLVELNEGELWTRWMLPDWPAEQIAPQAVKLNQLWREASGDRIVFAEAGEVILTLFRRGYRLGLVSNTTSSVEAPLLLQELGVAGCFEVVSLSCVEGVRKPDPAILLDAARRMGVEPARCAYIGDRPDRDVAAARGAGFGRTVIRRNRRKLSALLADPTLAPEHVVTNLRELLTIFPAPTAQTGAARATRPPRYDVALSTMWAKGNFRNLDDFFLASGRLGYARVELNHQMDSAMLAQVDLAKYQLSSIHEPCPADISMEALKNRDWLISSTDEECRRQGVAAVKRSIDLAAVRSVRMLVVHSGHASPEMALEKQLRRLYQAGQTDGAEYQELHDRMVAARRALIGPCMQSVQKSLRELLEYAGRSGICLGLENRYHYNDIPSQDELALLLELAGPERIGFIYDVGHATAMDRLGFFPGGKWLERFSARIVGTHLHDVIGLTDHQAPGLGEVDFHSLAPYLPQAAFRTVEVLGSNTPEQLRTGLKILFETGCIRKLDPA